MSAPAPRQKSDQTVPAGDPGMTGASTHARSGDEIVVRSTSAGGIARDGEIVGLHHPDGSPPRDVRGADGGRVTPYFPGPDARNRHLLTGGGHVPAR
ncbi:DUF1918 domain-containing protein [Streptomyces sp. NPDC012751]|uniref:DUF1918 domain-containing protein n=1 Tax=Streptomyces sp. NPDC012751 TaxID=3364846 RepID=UPI0036814115